MIIMRKSALVAAILLLTPLAWGQSVSVVSHYPASAYVIKRLLPFVLSGDNGATLFRVDSSSGHCSSMVDPYYENIFHLYCRKAVVVDLQIWGQGSDGETFMVPLDNLSIATQRAPGDGFDSITRSAGTGGGEE